MKRLRYIQLALAGLSLVLLSCADDREPVVEVPHGVPAEIEVTIAGMERPETRRNADKNSDYWTTMSFSAGDKLGLYSTGGNMVDGISDSLRNDFMDYYQATGSSNYKFRNDELLINTAMMGGKVAKYVYFPYTDEMPWPYIPYERNLTANKYYEANPFNKKVEIKTNGTYTGTYAPHIADNKFKDGMLLRRIHQEYTEPKEIEKTVDGETITKTIYVTKAGQKTEKGIDIPAGVVVYPDPSAPKDGVIRCVDYMYIASMSLTNGALGGRFDHAFCEMVIIRGHGFDKLDDEKLKNDIKVVLNRGVTRLTLGLYLTNSTGVYTWMPKYWPYNTWSSYSALKDSGGNLLTYDGLTEEDAKKWQAWPGEQYVDTNEAGFPVLRDAWYAIMPTAHSYSHTIADYIEIYNDEGILCKVSNFDLYTNTTTGISDKQMRPGYRFAVEVMMTEHGATARPVEISQWVEEDPIDPDAPVDPDRKDSHDITDERTVGIDNEGEFADWIEAYNGYANAYNFHRPANENELKTSPVFEKLREFGDYSFDDQRWQFYITKDIDMSSNDIKDIHVGELCDLLEGASTTNNYTITNLRRTFIEKISGNGELRNLDFDNLYISSKATTGSVGALTNNLNGGTIENCRINNGTMVGTGGVNIGMLAGTVNGGTVKNCTLSGAVIGATAGGDYAGLFGEVEGVSPTVTDTTNGLIIK